MPGPVVMQVLACTDVARPTRAAAAGAGGPQRMLRFKLTDGRSTCIAIEHEPIGSISSTDAVPPGCKIQIARATARQGEEHFALPLWHATLTMHPSDIWRSVCDK